MASSQRGKVQIELGRTLTTYAAMTDSGDHQVFTAGSVWSGKADYEPEVRPNGIVTGRNLLTASSSSDTVSIARFTAYSKGSLQTVTATNATFTRPATADKAVIYSVTMASDGSISVIKGTIGAGTTFSSTRDGAGGPPYIPADSVELGQLRICAATTSTPISSSEIYQVPGTHQERYDYPDFEFFNIGKGEYADSSSEKNSHVKFNEALSADHTGAAYKKTYVQYYTPSFTTLAKTVDFVPSEVSHSKSSESYYKGAGGSGAIGSVVADSVTDASFTVMAGDALTDAILAEKNDVVTVKWYPDANKDPYLLTQGTLGISRVYPIDAQNKINCTIYCESESAEFAS
jgi:hypothetical protein